MADVHRGAGLSTPPRMMMSDTKVSLSEEVRKARCVDQAVLAFSISVLPAVAWHTCKRLTGYITGEQFEKNTAAMHIGCERD
eukprot:9157404-Pyramimonas_sp.AAC.1